MSKLSFLGELQRRHVYKVGATYAVAGWLLVQIATQVFPFFSISNGAVRWVVIIVIAGFPIALIMAWLFDMTPDGVVRTGELVPGEENRLQSQTRRGTDRKLNILLGLLLLLSIGYILLDHVVWKRALPVDAIESMPVGKSIAVLPFESLSDDKSNAYFAIGIQDEILTRLAKIGSLRVISRSSTSGLASKPDDLAEMAKQLGVDNFLEGSVQKIGNTVHINVQLIHAASNDHLWAETYDRKLDQVFEVEVEVAQAIAEALKLRLSGAEHQTLNEVPTQNPQAYDAYLRGIAFENGLQADADDLDAARQFQQAVEIDPAFALAWAHLSIVHSRIYFIGGLYLTPERVQQMQQAAETAMKLQPNLGEAWLARAYYFYRGRRDYSAALTDFERAGELLPNNAEAIAGAAYVKRRQGHFAEAQSDLESAVRRDPQNLSYWTTISETALALYRFDDARSALERAMQISPNNAQLQTKEAQIDLAQGRIEAAQAVLDALPLEQPDAEQLWVAVARSQLLTYQHRYPELIDYCNRLLARQYPAYITQFLPMFYQSLGAAYLQAGKPEDARATLERGRALALDQRKAGNSDAFLSFPLGMIEAGLGHRDAALEEVRRLSAVAEDDAWIREFMVAPQAQIQMLAGDDDAALATLSRASIGLSTGDLRFNPVWDGVRADPPFQKVLEKAKPVTASP